MKTVYLDHAATTPICPEALQAMLPYFNEFQGNPSSLYEYSDASRQAIRSARESVAALLDADPDSIFFTSGGTEADNWALRGVAEAFQARGRHLIVSAIEHHAILHTADALERQGFSVTRLLPDENGILSPASLEAALRPDTILVSIMMANNEIGTVEPVQQLAETAHRHGALFHTDAVQAVGQIPVSASKLNFDLLSASAHKLYGPKGIGCLYIRPGLPLPPLLYGGAQEQGRRAGTENVPAIVGFGEAARLALQELQETAAREQELRSWMAEQVLREIPFSRLNGTAHNRLPGNLNFSFQFVDGSALLLLLDVKGICASAGSACTSGSHHPSHVLRAIGLPDSLARASLRLTLGRTTTKEELQYTLEEMKSAIASLRELSEGYSRCFSG